MGCSPCRFGRDPTQSQGYEQPRPRTGAVIRCHDPDARWRGRVGVDCTNAPHFASVVAGTLPHVDEETSNDTSNETSNDTLNNQVDEALGAIADVRRQLGEVPAEVVVTNHVMGLYELAAIHLSAVPPDLFQAALAIDAVGCLVEGLGERLGEDAATMRDALANIRLAFVQIKNQLASESAADGIDDQSDVG